MLRLWLHISTRWLIIFTILFSTVFLGFINVKKDDQLFLRNISNFSSGDKSVRGSTSQSAQIKFINSQIQELGIESKKANTDQGAPLRDVSDGTSQWGTAKQVDKYTWTIKVGEDQKNGTAQEILTALNNYRQRNGRGALNWDNGLANYASSRASYFNSTGKLDGHAGFTDYVNNQDGFHKLGFMSLGENSSYGYTLEAAHLIEWVYAGDAPHNNNQLDSKWSYVGIGVSGTAMDLIFGGGKL